MTNLKTANIGFNKFCGPAVLSILTGKSTDECARVITSISGQYNVTGVQLNDLLRAADKLGFDQIKQSNCSDVSLYRALTYLVHKNGIYIVTITGHFVVVEVNNKKLYFCDNHTKEPIPAASSARLMQKVLAVHQVIERKKKIYQTIHTEQDETFTIFIRDYLIASGMIDKTARVNSVSYDNDDRLTINVTHINDSQVEVEDE